ncbi:hypothetical protein BJX76DRAFT_340681 [Aspergillus varians]
MIFTKATKFRHSVLPGYLNIYPTRAVLSILGKPEDVAPSTWERISLDRSMWIVAPRDGEEFGSFTTGLVILCQVEARKKKSRRIHQHFDVLAAAIEAALDSMDSMECLTPLGMIDFRGRSSVRLGARRCVFVGFFGRSTSYRIEILVIVSNC